MKKTNIEKTKKIFQEFVTDKKNLIDSSKSTRTIARNVSKGCKKLFYEFRRHYDINAWQSNHAPVTKYSINCITLPFSGIRWKRKLEEGLKSVTRDRGRTREGGCNSLFLIKMTMVWRTPLTAVIWQPLGLIANLPLAVTYTNA